MGDMSFSIPIDDATLTALRGHCRQAQESVYRDYSEAAWTLALRLSGCEATAWDAVQSGFVRAFDRIGQLERADRFGPWLRRIVVNQVMDAGRLRLSLGSVESVPEPRVQGPEDGLDLLQAISRLDRWDRSVLWLHDVEGMTHAEIARTLEQSVPWSKTRLSRARGRVRELLNAAPAAPPRSLSHV